MNAPDLRLDELKDLAEQADLTPFLQRAVHVHPSDLAASIMLRGTLL